MIFGRREAVPEKKPGLSLWSNLMYLTQMGLSLAMPMILCIAAAAWLQNRFGLGGWVVIAGIVLGVGGTVSTFRQILRRESQKAKRETQQRNAFNDRYKD